MAPAEIEKGFMKKYPDHNVVKWRWDSKLVAYEGLFYERERKYYAYFNIFGKWLHTDRHIEVEDLPADVTWEINNTYIREWTVNNVIEQQNSQYDLVYLIDVQAPGNNGRGQKLLLHFLPDGVVVEIERDL